MLPNDLMLCPRSPGHHRAAGQPHGAAARLSDGARLSARAPQRQRAAGAGEAAHARPAEGGAGQLPQAAVSAPAGAAALGEGARAAPAAGGGHRGPAEAPGGGVPAAGGEELRPPESCRALFNGKGYTKELGALLLCLKCTVPLCSV